MSTTLSEFQANGVTWDLSALFASLEDPKIEETWESCHKRADSFSASYRGKLGTLTPEEFLTALVELENLVTESSKPSHYAGLKFTENTGDPELGAFYQEQSERSSELRVKLMFFDLELQEIEEQIFQNLLGHGSLADYRHYLLKTRALKPHMLSETEEVLLEETANTGSRAWVRLHEEVTSNHNFKLKMPGTEEVQEVQIEEIMTLMRNGDRAVRQAAADALSQGMEEIERVICFTYNTLLADKKLEDRLRKFEYPEQARHIDNELSKETVDIVMRLCRERSNIVERYYLVKREILGLEELSHIDRYAPLGESKKKVNWAEAKQIVLESFGEFSPILKDKAEEFFDKNWIHAEVSQGKASGAFCSYNTVDTHPVMLMSYQGLLNDVGTLAHELGHGVHASLSRAQTTFNFSGTLPLAELASIFGEMLVFDKIVKDVSDEDKLSLYANKIEGVFASVHRQAAMFRFEQRCHTQRRTEGELSAEQFGDIWQDELQSMFGTGVTLGEQHRRWWQYIGHFFFLPFYVYAYSFGELLTMSLYERAKQDPKAFAEKYVEVLTLGGKESPHALMGRLGIDLDDPAFWEGGFKVLEEMVATFETLWAKKQST
ncbi:MAG: M3 family oligoendopeptidase [Fimbriimonadaceae bacterium]|jgi:oligoendopeptidase F|nr:M3 family oligoendopeptidase [Fimbriimonadaceae bacterium]